MKNVIITGASGGIGSEIVKNFINNGYFVIGLYFRHKPKLISGAEFFKCNLANEKEINTTLTSIIKKFKQIDCLVNAAGVSQFKQIQDVTGKDFDKIVNINLKSAILVSKFVAKNMIFNKSGKIINISSMWGNVGASVESVYSASKGAINTFTLSLAKELAPSGITVNAVCPGLINTKMNANLNEEDLNNLVSATPLGRIGTPTDVANVVEFLSSNKANFITGQLITVDGGLSL